MNAEQPEQQQTFPSVNLALNADSLTIQVMLAPGLSFHQALGEPIMNQIAVKWLETHPALLNEIAKQALLVKNTQLQVIQSVKKSKVN